MPRGDSPLRCSGSISDVGVHGASPGALGAEKAAPARLQEPCQGQRHTTARTGRCSWAAGMQGRTRRPRARTPAPENLGHGRLPEGHPPTKPESHSQNKATVSILCRHLPTLNHQRIHPLQPQPSQPLGVVTWDKTPVTPMLKEQDSGSPTKYP